MAPDPRRTALFAGVVTGLTLAALLLVIKALFFFADNGYPRSGPGRRRSPVRAGADCVYQRYLDAGHGPGPDGRGVTDAASFSGVLLARAAG